MRPDYILEDSPAQEKPRLVRQTELNRIEEIVRRVYRHHFGSHPAEIRLEPGNDFLYGDDLVDIYIDFDLLPAELGGPDWDNFLGRKSLDFKEQVEEGMVEAGLFVDTVFWYQSPDDLEPALPDG